ncbi:unnamed protein product, partial [Mesorhabditis belari]|uniref:Bromodomain adjacent to zinc finger domain protein 2B n=1 Tax=Mesorhabditis belari TaxID=2138241 RepID=A0AAF3EB56_9BILA
MADPNALLRLLAAQQMMGLQNSQANASTSSSRGNQSNGNSLSNQLAATMSGFGALNPQAVFWQNMLLAQQQQQQALAIAQLFQAQQSSSRSSSNTPANSLEEALKKLVAAQQGSTKKSHEKPTGSSTNGNGHTNGTSTSSPAKLEPGEVPKKTTSAKTSTSSTPSTKKSTSADSPSGLAAFSNLLEAFKAGASTPSNNLGASSSSQPPLARLFENMKGNSGSNPFLAGLSNQRDNNNAMWQLLAHQLRNSNSKSNKSSQQTPKGQKENGYNSSNSFQKTPDFFRNERDSLTPADEDNRQRKHVVTDVEAVRRALDKGWRRQTCIRQLTTAGIRGDVVYYAPCGKKLSTYAEVLRYLQRAGPNEITRDHFSFSCKMIVGEFIWFKTDKNSGENAIVKLSEEEVTNELQKLMKPKAPKIVPEKSRKLAQPPKKIKEEEEFFDHGEETFDDIVRDADEAKGSRIPVDDLFLEEIRPLPTLPRIENLHLKGDGFANALMIHEFLLNFHHVLKIEKDFLPTLDSLCAGLAGEESKQAVILNLTKTLLSLAFESPGFPRKDNDPLRQQAGELELSRENLSELMRMWLQTRDKQGKELSLLLETAAYEELSGEKKADILAYICNELLYCRNIIREIDSNLEEIAKLRGERWMREGKVRALRGVHTRKTKKRKQEAKATNGENGDVERPESRNSINSDGSRPASPAKKTFTPGIGQCEILTAEEENMNVEELEVLIDSLNGEADQIRKNVNHMSNRVRTFPLGQDRFHRLYWQLPNVSAVLVEGVESAAKNNAAVNLTETCHHDPAGITEPSDFVDPDVIACIEDTIDLVIIGGRFDKKKKQRRRRLENVAKRGWWTVDQASLRPLRESLHGRGIRERALHRLLLRESFLKERQWTTLSVEPKKKTADPAILHAEQLYRAERALREIENRVSDASLQIPGWKPPHEPFDEAEDVSNDSWTCHAHLLESVKPTPALEDLRIRLLSLEANIERRYLRQNFFAGENVSVRKVMGKEEANKEQSTENGTTEEVDGEVNGTTKQQGTGQEDEDEEEKELCDIWRQAVTQAQTPATIVICAQVFEQSIAWEKSAMKAACQVCRTSDNEDQLLLCDLCDLGYHLYCFRPVLKQVPEGEWYCPKCKEAASGKPTCLLCSQQRLPIYGCQKCFSFFHVDCAGEVPPENPRQYKCTTCGNRKKTVRVLERDCESRATSETGSDDFLNQKKPVKRKAATDTLVFPHSMVADLSRTMLDELEAQQQAGPFMEPVDEDEVPGYRDIIKHPMDMQTMRDKADAGSYNTPEDFHADVELMFTNCRTFNEDDSPIGQAGIQLHKFFSKRWRQVRYNFCKRLKRMKPSY